MRRTLGPVWDVLKGVAISVLSLIAVIGIGVFGSLAYLALFEHDGEVAESAWPESDEFEHLLTGQDRFSEHETNVSRWVVVVDHATGNQYIASVDGDAICPILDVDGTPLRVMEAADDGEEK